MTNIISLLESLVDLIVVPDVNCSCHLHPPCSDCVDNGHAREVIEEARACIRELSEGKTYKKYQPCGCVLCTCDDYIDDACHGCGAKSCAKHPNGSIPISDMVEDGEFRLHFTSQWLKKKIESDPDESI